MFLAYASPLGRERHPKAGVIADPQAEGREQLALELFGQSELRLEHRELVEQVGSVVTSGRTRLGIGKLLRLGPALTFQLREAGSQTLAERVVRVDFLDLGDQPVLLPRWHGQGGDSSAVTAPMSRLT
ncbi:hypothetical protein [Microbispora sp. NPDC046933]|uniref:hypothetical protein n=1 Tax=Microbispora sp. NPDC046933 TaxID=3155618 RepID=UPI00340AD0C8